MVEMDSPFMKHNPFSFHRALKGLVDGVGVPMASNFGEFPYGG